VLLPAGGPPRWAVQNLGTALGFEPGLDFERTELTLHPGDALILYSDGVSEAFSPQEECYGNDRLLSDAGRSAGQAAATITTNLLDRVRAFAGSAPQSDDIAILTVKVNACDSVNFELQATPEEVMRGVELLREFATARGLTDRDVFRLSLALEECASNIVNHALQRNARKTFEVNIERTRDRVVIELRDDGPEFDPTATPALAPEPNDDQDDSPGGWGIELVRRNIDDIRYQREAGRNVLRLTKRLASAVGGD
jgi:sigma-B regulation protein RsbU (phosphoserine phosphatase)